MFANHVRWCEKNPKHNEICGEGLAKKLTAAAAKLHLEKTWKQKTILCQMSYMQ